MPARSVRPGDRWQIARCRGDTGWQRAFDECGDPPSSSVGTCAAGDDRKLGSAESTTYGFVKLFVPPNHPLLPSDLHQAPEPDRVRLLAGRVE
ncbi:MAG: hypothetical protein EKK31_04145 [Hyphomicrobiales bacterium]|nr:MAG: hypothetical protein EKK31_04145 [Hyphomicrobiales bacterium]